MDSFIEEVRRLRQQTREHTTKLLDVPGYAGRFAIRYGPGDRDSQGVTAVLRAAMIGEPLSKTDELQLLIDCHQEILVRRDGRTSEPTPYDDTGRPLRFDAGDERWTEILGQKFDTARDIVEAFFMYAEHPTAGAGHVGSLLPMLQGLERDLTARVEGKSSSGPGSNEPS